MIDVTTLTPEERKIVEARREYQRKWRKANKDMVKQHRFAAERTESGVRHCSRACEAVRR